MHLLSKVVRSRECFAAVRTDVWPLLGMGPYVPSRREQSAVAEIGGYETLEIAQLGQQDGPSIPFQMF